MPRGGGLEGGSVRRLLLQVKVTSGVGEAPRDQTGLSHCHLKKEKINKKKLNMLSTLNELFKGKQAAKSAFSITALKKRKNSSQLVSSFNTPTHFAP